MSPTKVEDGPFPWQIPQPQTRTLAVKPKTTDPSSVDTNRRISWELHIRESLDDPLVTTQLDELQNHDRISLWLPLKVTTAGVVLKHAVQVVENLFDNWSPMIYKFGFTSNPKVRWENRKYGYAHDRDKWEQMVVLYLSPEPWSPAMLEAALIDRYDGALAACNHSTLYPPACYFPHEGLLHISHITQDPQASQGQPGCRNIRKGGDSVGHDTSAAYATYMVYRSFKYKPV